jgi:hypothetical protein
VTSQDASLPGPAIGAADPGRNQPRGDGPKTGSGIQMNQTDQQGQGAATAKPGKRRDWEFFWRIIAGLMLIVIAWVVWVLYQITPRSVVTPLAYEPGSKLAGKAQTPAGAPALPAPPIQTDVSAVSAPQRAAGAAADAAMDQAQAAARAGAHQSSADVQAAGLEQLQKMPPGQEPLNREGLKLSTEITTPLVEKKAIAPKQ